MTQTERVIEYMKRNGSITSRQAFIELGVQRLASRIHEIREAGIKVSSEMVTVPCRDGSKARVARYWLPEVEA